jgi:hypothetical protein
MNKDQELLLAVEDIDSEGAVINRRRLEEEEEQSPLIGEDSITLDGDNASLKSIPFDQLPWYRRPSVGTSHASLLVHC